MTAAADPLPGTSITSAPPPLKDGPAVPLQGGQPEGAERAAASAPSGRGSGPGGPPPAVLLHGFLGRGADWAPAARRLAETRTILAPDLPGHGAAPTVLNAKHSGAIAWHSGADAERSGADAGRSGADADHPGDDVGRSGADADRSGDAVGDSAGSARHSGGDARRSGDDAEPFDAPGPRPGGLADAADRLAEALDGLGPVDLAGYSMGGRLALLFALRHPGRVCRLVLVSASPGLRTAGERAARQASDAALAVEIEQDFPAFLDRWARQPLFASLSDDQRARLVADRLQHGRPPALARALVGMGTGTMPSLWEPLRTLGVQAHVVAGALDPKFVGLAREVVDANPRVGVHVLPGAGHNLLAEAPGALADLLSSLLA